MVKYIHVRFARRVCAWSSGSAIVGSQFKEEKKMEGSCRSSLFSLPPCAHCGDVESRKG